jgi:WD40 repeat protein
VAIAPDGSWLASGGTVRIWHPVTGSQRNSLSGHTGGVGAVAIAPDGSWLASGGDDDMVRS